MCHFFLVCKRTKEEKKTESDLYKKKTPPLDSTYLDFGANLSLNDYTRNFEANSDFLNITQTLSTISFFSGPCKKR
jgi:hypothetical protein